MNKHQIGLNAGVVWRLLNDNNRWSYCELDLQQTHPIFVCVTNVFS